METLLSDKYGGQKRVYDELMVIFSSKNPLILQEFDSQLLERLTQKIASN